MVQIRIIDVARSAIPFTAGPSDVGDVVVLHGCSGGDTSAQELALTLASKTKVIVLFPVNDPPDVDIMRSAGVAACFPQSVPANDLVPMLIAAADGPERAFSRAPSPELPTLSRREHEVINLIAHGFTHQQIARRLKISIHTVDTYVRRIKDKWNLGNKADLTRAAMPIIREPTPAPS